MLEGVWTMCHKTPRQMMGWRIASQPRLGDSDPLHLSEISKPGYALGFFDS